MKLEIKIETSSALKMVHELEDILIQVKGELFSPICKGCRACKDPKKGCITGGGSSEENMDSTWNLGRKKKEHSKICSSKQAKAGVV